jgi:hypothetical protein
MNPIHIIDELLKIVMVGVLPVAIASGIVCLFSKDMRLAVPVGLVFAVVGFFLSVNAIGGFKAEPGSFGRAIAFAIGPPGAGAGFLIGSGLVVIIKRWRIGIFFLVAGLALPFLLAVRPALIKREQLLWQNLIATGKVEHDLKYYQRHLSNPTRQELNNRIDRPEWGLIPSNVLELMDSLGFDVARYPNLSPELAYKLWRSKRNLEELAQNPSIPQELRLEIYESNDIILREKLAYNKSLDDSMKASLVTNFNAFISERKNQKKAYGSDYYAAVSGLKWLQREINRTNSIVPAPSP